MSVRGIILLVLRLVPSETVLVLERRMITEPTFDHERLDVYRLSIHDVGFVHATRSMMNHIVVANQI